MSAGIPLCFLVCTCLFLLGDCSTDQRTCPEGFIFDECWACQEGKYYRVAYPSMCRWCPEGYTRLDGDPKCYICGVGKYSDVRKICQNCVAGKFSNALGLDAEADCRPCAVGKSSIAGAVECVECVPGEDCFRCPAGEMLDSSGTGCEICEPGSYSPRTSNYCHDCPHGKISVVQGAVECDLCPRGNFSSELGSTICFECGTLQYSPDDRGSCVDCPNGTLPNHEGPYCALCPAGTVRTSGQSSCVDCGEGKYSADDRATCEDCGVGKYSNVTGLGSGAECAQCDAGKISIVGQSSCVECGVGKYSADNRVSCEDCGVGKYSNVTGTGSEAECTQCEAGKFSISHGVVACIPCVAGKTSRAAVECIPCAPGTFALSDGGVCAPCAPGTYSINIGAVGCLACADGSTSLPGSSSPRECRCTPPQQTKHIRKFGFMETMEALEGISVGGGVLVPNTSSIMLSFRSSSLRGLVLLDTESQNHTMIFRGGSDDWNNVHGPAILGTIGSGYDVVVFSSNVSLSRMYRIDTHANTFVTTDFTIGSADGKGTNAQFRYPENIVATRDGAMIFIAEPCFIRTMAMASMDVTTLMTRDILCDSDWERLRKQIFQMCISPDDQFIYVASTTMVLKISIHDGDITLLTGKLEVRDDEIQDGPLSTARFKTSFYIESASLSMSLDGLFLYMRIEIDLYGIFRQGVIVIDMEYGMVRTVSAVQLVDFGIRREIKHSLVTHDNMLVVFYKVIDRGFSTVAVVSIQPFQTRSTPLFDAYNCSLCVPGEYVNTSRAAPVEACFDCIAVGTAPCAVCTENPVDLCEGCASGKFSISPQSTACLGCDPGTFSLALASTACLECIAGKFASAGDNATGCVDCVAGTYSATPRASSNDTCVPCEYGKFSGTVGASAESSCGLCPAGSYAGEDTACIPCDAGKYSPENGAFAETTCRNCPDKSGSPPGSTQVGNCTCVVPATAAPSEAIGTTKTIDLLKATLFGGIVSIPGSGSIMMSRLTSPVGLLRFEYETQTSQMIFTAPGTDSFVWGAMSAPTLIHSPSSGYNVIMTSWSSQPPPFGSWTAPTIRRAIIRVNTDTGASVVDLFALGHADGIGSDATLSNPRYPAATGDGRTVFFADATRIRRLNPEDMSITTFAGSGSSVIADGVGTTAGFANILSLCISADEGLMYVAHTGFIRRITIATAHVVSFAGASDATGDVNGFRLDARFGGRLSLSIGHIDFPALYIADRENNVIKQIDIQSGLVTTLAGDGGQGIVDGIGLEARFRNIRDIYIFNNHLIVYQHFSTSGLGGVSHGDMNVRTVNVNDGLVCIVLPGCNAGFTGPDGGPCTACEAGKFKIASGADACSSCGAGWYSSAVGSESDVCQPCPANATSPEGSTIITQCQCDSGFTGVSGTQCLACAAGKFKTAAG